MGTTRRITSGDELEILERAGVFERARHAAI
jgi:hypothetical protein